MKLFGSPYTLRKKAGGTQPGVLLKIVEGEHFGVADLSPRTELGDADAQTEVRNRGPLFLRAMELALEDWMARKNGKSLLRDKPVRNNFLITDYKKQDLNPEIYRGHTVKVKCDADLTALAARLKLCPNDVTLRLDFNSRLTAAEYQNFLTMLSGETLKKIEYVEDPTPLNALWPAWNKIVPLAFDFQPGPYSENAARYRILKPARERVETGLQNFTLTSAMDHPVGVAHGLRLAQEHARGDSGFLTLDLYEPTGFEPYFVQDGCLLNFAETAEGIGMNEQLARLEWSEL